MQSSRIAFFVACCFMLLAFHARTASAQIPSNPCALVTAAQVSAALGENVAAGKQAPAVTCTWVADKPTHQIVTLNFPPFDWTSLKNRQMPGVTKAAVSGLGDDAISQTAANLATLFVRKGRVVFMVRVYGVPDATKQLAIEKPIAQVVAAHI
jgi:Mrp family chromosome partitioning ATPase